MYLQSSVLAPLHSYDETVSYESNKLENLNRNGCVKIACFGTVFVKKTKCEVECENLSSSESNGDDKELINLLRGQKDHLKRELDEKNNIISFLEKTREPYLIQEKNVFYNTKDGVSTEKVS